MNIWITLLGMAIVTLITRAAPLLLRDRLSPAIERRLAAVPIAVFTALAIPPLIISAGVVPQLSFGTPLIAGVAGAIAAWRSNSVVVTIVVGMAAFWISRFFGG
ncbi:MAG: AzlD domain-containing protein [Oscillochloris sp.]|nr:AzlD domain-containing protein [Oscillochloris sp.]